jgi:uncharacterized cupin superfamily protein
MPVHTAASFIREETPAPAGADPNLALWISEAGALTQFGAYVEILQPGTCSSIKHWHSAEDEMVYVLAGQVTLVEGDAETLLNPGDAATFRAGEPVGHCLWNRSTQPTRCLVVGTRAPVDRVSYPDHDRVCLRDRALPDDIWVDNAGQPASRPY